MVTVLYNPLRKWTILFSIGYSKSALLLDAVILVNAN